MVRALILVAGWVGQAFAGWLATLKRPLASEVAALRESMEKLRAENDLLRARLERVDPRVRPRYKPWERLQVLLHRARYGLSIEAAAKAFLVTPTTILNWLKEVQSGAARLVQARKPLNALPDLVREVVHFLKRQWPRWGTRRIAGILARLGMMASRTSVQRLLRKPPPWRAPAARRGRAHPLPARHAGHVWIVDFTHVRRVFHNIVVGAVLDAWSRKVLSVRVWPSEPDALGAVGLIGDALRRHGKPTWIVTDLGRQFRARRFKAFLGRRGIRRRYAAVGDPNLGRLDRFWRTMKEEFARGLFLFRPLRTVERQIRDYVRWYDNARPHAGLGFRTPRDAHAGRRPRRARRIESGSLEVRYLDKERLLPLFRIREAA